MTESNLNSSEPPAGSKPAIRRRCFLKYSLCGSAAAIGASAWWLSVSRRRGARWFRQMAADARRPILAAPARPSPERWSDQEVTLSWLGHSTVLINFYGIKVLTDPALGTRVGISLGLGVAGPKRYMAPAL